MHATLKEFPHTIAGGFESDIKPKTRISFTKGCGLMPLLPKWDFIGVFYVVQMHNVCHFYSLTIMTSRNNTSNANPV